jgi:hypothetical protein
LDRFARHPRSALWIANTDADSSASRDWIGYQLSLAAEGYCAVAGIVRVEAIADLEPEAVRELLSDYTVNADGSHPHVHGANFGIRADAYLDAGGWGHLALAEDHCLWRRVRARNWRVISSARSVVTTSGRLTGRAIGGSPMACGEGLARSMPDLAQRLRDLLGAGKLDLPLPGHGHTGDRHRALLEFAREDLALARLIEAHIDAVAIAYEAGMRPHEGSLYGVWASDGPASRLEVERLSGGSMLLQGVKQFCTGATFLDAALVTAYEGAQRILLEVPLNNPGLTRDASGWSTPAFAETVTATVSFSGVVVESAAVVGAADWYLARPGFWHGAVGPAACWAGGAIALIDAVRRRPKVDTHWRVHMGALQASEWALRAILAEAGRQIDEDPEDHRREAQTRALIARHLIERTCTEVMDRFGRVTGPRLLAFDAAIAKHYSELTLYIRQCHAEADLEQIPGRRVL